MRLVAFSGICLTTLILTACGGTAAPQLSYATGIVKFKGKPLSGAQVLFTPENGPMAMGMTNDEGEFQLATQGEEGAVIGPHRVTIRAVKVDEKAAKAAVGNDNAVVPVTSLIPEKYGILNASGLTASVEKEADKNQYTFELK